LRLFPFGPQAIFFVYGEIGTVIGKSMRESVVREKLETVAHALFNRHLQGVGICCRRRCRNSWYRPRNKQVWDVPPPARL